MNVQNKGLSLRSKLIALFLAIGLLPLIIAAAINSWMTIGVLRSGVIEQEQSHLENVSTAMEGLLSTTVSDIQWLSESVSMRRLSESIAQQSSLELQSARQTLEQDFISFVERRQINERSVYRQVRFLNAAGVEFVRVDNIDGEAVTAQGLGLSFNSRANREYFQETRELPAGEIYVSQLELFEEFGEIQEPYVPVLRYATPIYHEETFVGVLVTDVQAESMLEIADTRISVSTTPLLVDLDGYYLRNPDVSQLYGRSLETDSTLGQDYEQLAGEIQNQTEGVLTLNNALAIYASVELPGEPDFRWVAISMRPISSVLAIIWQQLFTVIFTLIVVSVVVIVIAIYFAGFIGDPIARFTQQALNIAGGDLHQRVDIDRNDEIGRLANAFNQMTAQLQDLIGSLEERVRQRTHELEEARDVAEKANQAKTEFLSNMSHELRTPLNMVIGYTSSMLNMPGMYDNTELPPVFKSDIELIQRSGKHLLALINDILDLSKVEAGRLELEMQSIELTEMFDGIIATSVGLVQEKPLQIQPQYPESLPHVQADPVRLRQVLLNLMSNAIKFTESGSVKLSAEVVGDYVRIAITDTGVGIPAEAIETIFDRFQQIKHADSIRGTGLGLDISQKLVQLHGGEIKIESQMGIGSTFSFDIPIAPEEHQPAAIAEQEKDDTLPTRDLEEMPASPQMALIAEDDSTTRQWLRRALESAEFVVIETSSGQEAVDMVGSLLPDIILLDVALEDMDGWSVARQIRQDAETQSTPILILTADATAGKADHELVDAIIEKPAEPQTIIETIQTLLAQQTSEKAR